MGEGAIYDLIDGVDRFPFARAAAQHEYARNKMEMSVAWIVLAVNLVLFLADDAGDAHRLAAMAAEYTAEMLADRFC
ncbi:MAG TPA: hypothetical protein VGI13_07795 [Candidatus Acidoferrum sp.]